MKTRQSPTYKTEIMKTINFWNGNKSAVRQTFELSLFQRVMNVCGTDDFMSTIIDDRTDYPNAKDEGQIFTKGADVCVTVAGNPKFTTDSYIPVYDPLMNGLLGHRLLIIRESDATEFSQIRTREELQKKVLGIPRTWADAPLFRDNGYQVNENGSFDELFGRLKAGECDYVSFGVNEVLAVFAEKAKQVGGLIIEPSLRLYYPFALVFYVHPEQPELVESIKSGLKVLRRSGEFDTHFSDYFKTLFTQAKLDKRHEIKLQNPALPPTLTSAMDIAANQLLVWS